MDEKLDSQKLMLSQQELADRWGVTVKAIEKWRREGILTPAKGVPVIRFSLSYIAALEGTQLERFSPIEKRKLERELEELKRERDMLKGIVSNILAETSKVISLN